MSRALVISLSDLGRDPRVDRQIKFLRSAHEVTAAGLGPPLDPDVEFVDLRVMSQSVARELARQSWSLLRLIARGYESVYWRHPINVSALSSLAGHQADVVVANDLTALPLACRVSGAAPVIFDAHELATEEHAERLWWRQLMAPYADHLLRAYLPLTAGMMTVAPGIAQRYAEMYGVDPVVVTNAPWRSQLQPQPVHDPIRLIHHGNADPQRRLELMIETADLLGDGYELSLMLAPSNPRYLSRLERMTAGRPRVRLLEPLPLERIVEGCNRHDVGIYLLPPDNENMQRALPNKLFEFIQARLAIAVGPSPEMAAIVREHACGVVADDFTPRALADVLAGVTREQIATFKAGANGAAQLLNAEQNQEIVLRLVSRALSG
jgi:hypothetical protein